jgi:hypothetical protein
MSDKLPNANTRGFCYRRIIAKIDPRSEKGEENKGHTVTEMLEIIQTFPELTAGVERTIHKVPRLEVEVSPDDFRHETAERLEILRRCDRSEHVPTR